MAEKSRLCQRIEHLLQQQAQYYSLTRREVVTHRFGQESSERSVRHPSHSKQVLQTLRVTYALVEEARNRPERTTRWRHDTADNQP